MYEARVRTGGAVYEEGHTLVLGWCENQRDEETMWKLLSQVRVCSSCLLTTPWKLDSSTTRPARRPMLLLRLMWTQSPVVWQHV